MHQLVKISVLSCLLALSGCGNKDNEPKTYGVRNSKWSKMNVAQRKEAQERYEHEIRISERRKVELEVTAQREREEKVRMEQRLSNLEQRHHSNGAAPTTVIIQQPATPVAAPAQMIYVPTPAVAQAQTVVPMPMPPSAMPIVTESAG